MKNMRGFVKSVNRLVEGAYAVPKHKPVPEGIKPPFYYKTRGKGDFSSAYEGNVRYYEQDTISKLRKANQIAAGALTTALKAVKIGITTDELDTIVHDYIISQGAYPAAIYYMGFPKSVCSSVNEVVCHGVPDLRPLQDGDWINLDVTTYIDGVFGDTSAMALAGTSHPPELLHLINVTKEALELGISLCKPGVRVNKIGEAIEDYAQSHGFYICEEFSGHGIGSSMHMPPAILHMSKLQLENDIKDEMRPGMVFTIEPIIMANPKYELRMWMDNWTVVDITGGASAQWEHSLVITEEGCEVLSRREDE